MAEATVEMSSPSSDNSSLDIAFLVENVYRDIIIEEVKCGALLSDMCLPDGKHTLCKDIQDLETNHRDEEACSIFLDYLKDRNLKTDYLLFLQSLELKGYIYVAKLLKGDDTLDPDIHQEHRRLILFFSNDISTAIDPDFLYPKLIEDDWLDQEDAQRLKRISEMSGRIPAARWLVSVMLPGRKENWLKQFLQLLWDYDHHDLVEWITDEKFNPNCLKSLSESHNDLDKGSGASIEDDSVRIHVITGSGEADDSLGNLNPVPPELNGYREETGHKSIERWIEDVVVPNIFGDDEIASIGSSEEDNTRIGLEREVKDNEEMQRTVDEVIQKRPYQDELSRSADNGSNVVIIAPTGSGKTVVALMIMREHLSRREHDGQKYKIAFFANQVTLVDQQHDLCKTHMEPRIKTMKVVGETKHNTRETLSEMIETNDLLVMTPQIIVDALELKTLTSLSVFTLIIFDECHHVRDKHPTNQIMSHYMEMKHKYESTMGLPQIIGLTASVGVGKDKEKPEKEGAKDHIMKLCANLDAKGGLVTVRENKDNLAEYANDVKSATKMAGERPSDPFKKCIISNIMEKIEERIINKQIETQKQLKHIKNLEREVKPCLGKGTSWYTQWLGKLYSDKFLRIKDAELRRFFLTCVGYLSVFNKALAINSDCRGFDAMCYIENKIKTLYPAQHYRTEADNWLYDLYTVNRKRLRTESRQEININPKLVSLKLLIQDQIKLKEESRIIVLVQTRDLARALFKWMIDDRVLCQLTPVVVTGCGASADQGGMTRAQQVEAVKNFKWGNSLVAIATSVAEEGMDVSKCSRVIRYEYVSNEIGMIQARGRASRVADGTCFTITSQDEVARKEDTNIRREGIMNDSIVEIQNAFDKDASSFRKTLDNIQKEEMNSREQEKNKLLAQPYTEETFQLCCYICGIFALKSTDIRIVPKSHHVVVSADIWKLVSEEEPEKREAFDDMQKVSAVHCKRCRSRWGSGVVYKGIRFVCISIVNFFCFDRSGMSHRWIKWPKVHFKCHELTQEDIATFAAEG